MWSITIGDERLVAYPFRRGRPINAVKILIDDRARTFALGKSGRFYASCVFKNFAMTARHSQARPLIHAAVAFGLLSKDVADRVLKVEDCIQKTRERKWAAEEMLKHASDAGIEFTPAQLRELKSAAGCA